MTSVSNNNNTNTKPKPKPKTVDNFKIDNVTVNGQTNYDTNGFVKYWMKLKQSEAKNNNDVIVRLNNIPVCNLFPPKPDDKYPKYNLLLSLVKNSGDDKKNIEFIQKIDEFAKNYVFDNKDTLLKNPTELDKEDTDYLYTPILKDDKYDDNKFSINTNFVYNNSDSSDNIKIVPSSTSIPMDIIQSDKPKKMLTRDSLVDIYLKIESIKIDSNNSFKIMTKIFKVIRLNTYIPPKDSNSSGDTKKIWPGMNFNTILSDKSKIILGKVQTNDNNGKFLKPQFEYSYKDEIKTKTISIQLGDTTKTGSDKFIECNFRKQVSTYNDTETINYYLVYNISKEHETKFKELGDHFLSEMCKKSKDIVGKKPGKLTDKLIANRYKNGLNISEEYGNSIWINVFSRRNPKEGELKFGENTFVNSEHVPYTDEQIESELFGKKHKCSVRIYVKHIWIGNNISLKYQVNNVIVDTNTEYYNLHEESDIMDDDTMSVDSPKPESSEKVSSNETSEPKDSDEDEEEDGDDDDTEESDDDESDDE